MNKTFHLTPDGVEELRTELNGLVNERGAIAERIKSAREFGDLSENAEYASALQEQERTENRISELEHILQNVKVINKPAGDQKVQLGSVVKLKNGRHDKTFKIVGTVEANPSEGKISDESPIGVALLDKKVGDEIEIKTPVELVNYKIVEIL